MSKEDKFTLGPKRLAFTGFFIAVLIIVIGFALSVISGDKMWASRFGSLVIVFGLLFLVFLRWRNGDLKKDDEAFEDCLSEALQAITGSQFDDAAKRLAYELNKYRYFVRNKWLFLSEIMIFSLGTFIWGFGDLLVCLVIECGGNKC